MAKSANSKILMALVMFLLLSPKTWAGANVSPEVIQETALHFLHLRSRAAVGGIKAWQGATLSEPVPYYDFFGNVIAYGFSVVNDQGEILGYIILSNSFTDHPIQEFSTSPPPHKRALASHKKEAEKYLLVHRLPGYLGQPSFIYLCPSIYFTRFPLLDKSGQKINSIFIEMRSSTVVSKEILQVARFPGYGRKNPYWNLISNESPGPTNASFSYIEHVPIYNFFISSHATAAAMALGYWDLRRPKEPEKTFIGEITNFITTCGCGRREEILEIAKGVKRFSALRGYRVKAEEWALRSTNPEEQMTFEDYQQEIKAGRPVVISFMHENKCAKDLYSAQRCALQTCVVGVGYLVDATGRFIIAHEGFFFRESPPEPNSASPWPHPGISFYNWDGMASNMILITINKPEKF